MGVWQIVLLTRRVVLPGGFFAGVAGEPPLLEPKCSAAGFKGATGIRVWGPLLAKGNPPHPPVSCPVVGGAVRSGVALVRLVAGMATVLLAPLKVSACCNVSLKCVGLRHQQLQALPGGGDRAHTLELGATPVYSC